MTTWTSGCEWPSPWFLISMHDVTLRINILLSFRQVALYVESATAPTKIHLIWWCAAQLACDTNSLKVMQCEVHWNFASIKDTLKRRHGVISTRKLWSLLLVTLNLLKNYWVDYIEILKLYNRIRRVLFSCENYTGISVCWWVLYSETSITLMACTLIIAWH